MIVRNDYSNGNIINLNMDKDFLFIDVAARVPKAPIVFIRDVYGLESERNINTNKLKDIGILDIQGYSGDIDVKTNKIAIFFREENAVLYTPLFQALDFLVLAVNKDTGYLETVNIPNSNFEIADVINIPNYKSYILSMFEKRRIVFVKSNVSKDREYMKDYKSNINLFKSLGDRPYSSNQISSYMRSFIAQKILDSKYSFIGGGYYKINMRGVFDDFEEYYEGDDTSYMNHKYYGKLVLDLKKLLVGYNAYRLMKRDECNIVIEKLNNIKSFEDFDRFIADASGLLKNVFIVKRIDEVYFPFLRVCLEFLTGGHFDTAMWGEKVV